MSFKTIQAIRIAFQILLAVNMLCPIAYFTLYGSIHKSNPADGDISAIIHQIFP